MAATASSGELLPAAPINGVIRRVCADKGVSFGSGAKDAIVKAATMSIFQLMDE
jgi:histone H3/H4